MSEQTELMPAKTAAMIGIAPGGGLRPENFEGLWRMSQIFAASGFMPKGMDKVESIFVAVQLGMEVGLSPMSAVQNIACINGRPTIWGDAMLGLVRGSGLLERIKEDLIGDGDTTEAICSVWRKGEEDPSVSRFSVADAKRAGLWGKAGPWTQYPRRMLQMRARGFALRDKFSDVLKGLQSREEVQDHEVYMGAADVMPAAETLDKLRATSARREPSEPVQEPSAPVTQAQPEQESASADWPKQHRGIWYDSRGVAHDPVVHSGGRSCNKDGTWRKAKGVNPATVAHAEGRYPKLDTLVTFGSGPAVESGGTGEPDDAPPPLNLATQDGPGFADVARWIAESQDMDELDTSLDAARDVDLTDEQRAQVQRMADEKREVLG